MSSFQERRIILQDKEQRKKEQIMKVVKFEISVLSKFIASEILLYESPDGHQVGGLPPVATSNMQFDHGANFLKLFILFFE